MNFSKNTQGETRLGIIYLIGATLIYSSISILIRLLDAGNIPPMSQVFLRYIFAFVFAGLYFKYTNTKIELKKNGNLFLLTLLSIFGYGFTNLLFTYGIINTLISNALFIFYSFAILTPILGYFVLKEKVNKYNMFALVIGSIAIYSLFQPNSFTTWKIGGLFALLAALTQSFYLIGRRKLQVYNSQTILLTSTFLGMVVVGIMSLIFENSFYFQQNGIFALSTETWIFVFLAGLANFAAWLLMSKGFELVKATTGSLVMLVENVFAIILALLIFGETPASTTFIGGILIIYASYLVIVKGDQS